MMTLLTLSVHDVSVSCFCALSHRFGRKPVFFLTSVLQAVTALIQATSVNWPMFCVLNCLRGLGQMSNYILSLTIGELSITCVLTGLKVFTSVAGLIFILERSLFNICIKQPLYIYAHVPRHPIVIVLIFLLVRG